MFKRVIVEFVLRRGTILFAAYVSEVFFFLIFFSALINLMIQQMKKE
jgi:hypothetical protein